MKNKRNESWSQYEKDVNAQIAYCGFNKPSNVVFSYNQLRNFFFISVEKEKGNLFFEI